MTKTSVEDLDRYSRQTRFSPLGETGQQRLMQSRVLLCGCGALGSVLANTLVRAGVGFIRIVDRDFLELSNLQRQVLFDEDDVQRGLPKAIAATNKLQRINSQVTVEPVVKNVNADCIEELATDVDLLLDGTDNFETRFLLNDLSIAKGIPWVYGGCIGAEGQSMTILPGETPCLHCLLSDGPPPPGTTETCDSAGILGSIINVIASIQANEAIKILSGATSAASRQLTVIDLWHNQMRTVNLAGLAEVDCPTCKRREFPWLHGQRGSHSAVLCGRNAVQLTFPDQAACDLNDLASRVNQFGQVTLQNSFLLRFQVDDYELTVFPDGRAIVSGTEEEAIARSVYARSIGN